MDLTLWKDKLDAYLDPQEGDMLRLLERIVNMDSFTTDAQDVDQLGTVLTDWLREAGFQTFMMPKTEAPADEPWQADLGHVFMAKTHGREAEPGIVFLGHMDTVFPKGTAQARPFKIEGDRATGPGVADMKAGVVANMFAARALKDLGLIDVPMTLMFSPDEELGAPTATRVYRERISGARAVICAEPGFPDGGVTTERRGSGHFHMRISGISAHAGRCYEDGASAILELAHKIVALDAFVDAQAQTIVNTGLISGGNSANAVAPWADARIHITFNTVDAAERLVENVRAVAARTFVPRTTTRISGGIRLHPLEYTADVETLFGMAERACAAMGGYTIRRNRALGASEAGFTASVLGIPSICSMGPEGAELHSPSEYLSVDTVLPRCKMIALTAIQAARAFPSTRV
jgi:glutamate carboxypeptidase